MSARPPPRWLAKCFNARLRWFLIIWMFVVSAVAYLDRVNISIAAQAIQRDYGLTDVQLGWVFSAFLIGAHARDCADDGKRPCSSRYCG
jgi:sugar phosphate permease